MNPYIREYNQYKTNSITTAAPETILIMLYAGAIKFLTCAKLAIEEKKIEDSHQNIVKAQKIIRELINSLDMENGGDIAFNLNRLYEYLHHQLIQANIKKDVKIIDEVLKHMRELKETWEKAIALAARQDKEAVNQSESIDITDRSA